MEPDFDWMNERVERTIEGNWLYRLLCFVTFRRKQKMTYKELYLTLRTINEKKLGQEQADRLSLKKVIEIYKYNKGTLPLGI
jgi:hypothetical protein